jgi:uncharacterized membrane protein
MELQLRGRNGRRFVWLYLTVAAAVLGVIFRLSALDTKAYWFDETFTSLRISGSTDHELIDVFRKTNDFVSAHELQKFQEPRTGRNAVDTVRGLALEEPQNPPLYFVMARLWAEIAGGSIYWTRFLTALLSLAVLPLIYWLCQELFGSALVGWIAVALISLSPLHVLFAQTARPQSLWTATIIFSSAALLRALRTQSAFGWGLYALGVSVCLYTFVLSGLFIAGFGLYVLALERFRLTKSLIACAIASTVGALSAIPWAVVLYAGRSNIAATTSWTEQKLSLVELIRAWTMGIVRLFFDINNQSGDSIRELLPLLLVLPGVLGLLSYSLYYLFRNTPRRTYLFIFLLAGSSFLPLAIFDVLNGGSRTSAAQRYLIPAYVGLQLTVAFVLAQKISFERAKARGWAWHVVTSFIFLLGITSCWASSRSESWWIKDPDGVNPEIARIINRSVAPLVISDGWMGHVLSLSSQLNEQVKLKIDPLCYVCSSVSLSNSLSEVPSGFSDVFYFHPGYEPGADRESLLRLVGLSNLMPIVTQRGRIALWKVVKDKQ